MTLSSSWAIPTGVREVVAVLRGGEDGGVRPQPELEVRGQVEGLAHREGGVSSALAQKMRAGPCNPVGILISVHKQR
jgi:hypothetical protein